MTWRSRAGAELFSLMALWEWIALSLHCWVLAVAAVSDQHATSPFDWLLSDKGPFHRSQEYTDFVDRSRQGFSTRYKIYRYEAKGKPLQSYLPRRLYISFSKGKFQVGKGYYQAGYYLPFMIVMLFCVI